MWSLPLRISRRLRCSSSCPCRSRCRLFLYSGGKNRIIRCLCGESCGHFAFFQPALLLCLPRYATLSRYLVDGMRGRERRARSEAYGRQRSDTCVYDTEWRPIMEMPSISRARRKIGASPRHTGKPASRRPTSMSSPRLAEMLLKDVLSDHRELHALSR